MTKAILGLLLILSASAVSANCPLYGDYSTNDGNMLPGRASESEPGGQSGEIGNAIFAESFDGQLGGQWMLFCPAICVEPELIENTVDDYGNGDMVYFTEYCGGQLWLNGTGEAWDNGAADYFADLQSAYFTTTITLVGGVPIFRSTTIEMMAQFVDCIDVCVFFDVIEAIQMGEDYGYNFPVDYPLPVFDYDCSASVDLYGSWWEIVDIAMNIGDCTVDTETSDWSQVKSLY
ncbi:hypothetical protein H8E52_01290 [bacterium]|nr:hypothetical protein [bacterium]